MTEKDYKNILKDREIRYRATLNLPKDFTFGVEIEYENVINDIITNSFLEEEIDRWDFYDWLSKEEIDITEFNSDNQIMNGEINSPILRDNVRSWRNLRVALNILCRNNAIVTSHCGAHVNIGSHVLGDKPEYLRNFFLLWVLYEKEIYKFCSGEFFKVRTRKDNVIGKMAPLFKKNIGAIVGSCNSNLDVFEYLSIIDLNIFDKMRDVSLYNYTGAGFNDGNRIEFRVPNGTLKEEIWQNYVNFFARFLLACRKELDLDKTLYQINNNEHSIIELVDYVFDENIDKDYFLIQALKTNKIYKKELRPHIYEYK